MAIAASNGLLPSIRTFACAILYVVLRGTHVLDKPWPVVGITARRVIMAFWFGVTSRLTPRLRHRLRGEVPALKAAHPMPGDAAGISPGTINLAACDSPVVSVIIPTYGQTGFTLRCLASIAANLPTVPIEILVVDDAFPDRKSMC